MVRQCHLEKQDQTSRVPPNFERPRRRMLSECSVVGNKKVVPSSEEEPHTPWKTEKRQQQSKGAGDGEIPGR
ncbi:hypothetical protein ANCCAN_08213 [Ancylostoma caninum]|uniref:Uncharacterized protein n=1 Tax=Ancylostoma caninum TaxID=29170 RepID=A0A368GN11_ANCCA|nr:hypothetical protein ANCCAN_08213 [Ancylostoma caninum]